MRGRLPQHAIPDTLSIVAEDMLGDNRTLEAAAHTFAHIQFIHNRPRLPRRLVRDRVNRGLRPRCSNGSIAMFLDFAKGNEMITETKVCDHLNHL
jgi:hypothetical protein